MLKNIIEKILYWCRMVANKYLISAKPEYEVKVEQMEAQSVWKNLGKIALAVELSYLSAKITNENTGWVSRGYRDQLINNVANIILAIAIQQIIKSGKHVDMNIMKK